MNEDILVKLRQGSKHEGSFTNIGKSGLQVRENFWRWRILHDGKQVNGKRQITVLNLLAFNNVVSKYIQNIYKNKKYKLYTKYIQKSMELKGKMDKFIIKVEDLINFTEYLVTIRRQILNYQSSML